MFLRNYSPTSYKAADLKGQKCIYLQALKKNVNVYVCLPFYTESVCVCKKMEETID